MISFYTLHTSTLLTCDLVPQVSVLTSTRRQPACKRGEPHGRIIGDGVGVRPQPGRVATNPTLPHETVPELSPFLLFLVGSEHFQTFLPATF
jgi:hypothetical protein